MTGRYPPLSTAGRKSLGWTCSTVPSRKRTAISRSAVRAMTMPRAPRATRRCHTGPIAITAVTRSPTSYSGGSSKVVAGTGHLGDSVDIEIGPPTDPRLRLVTRSLPAPLVAVFVHGVRARPVQIPCQPARVSPAGDLRDHTSPPPSTRHQPHLSTRSLCTHPTARCASARLHRCAPPYHLSRVSPVGFTARARSALCANGHRFRRVRSPRTAPPVSS